jgi:hypothetical protein
MNCAYKNEKKNDKKKLRLLFIFQWILLIIGISKKPVFSDTQTDTNTATGKNTHSKHDKLNFKCFLPRFFLLLSSLYLPLQIESV